MRAQLSTDTLNFIVDKSAINRLLHGGCIRVINDLESNALRLSFRTKNDRMIQVKRPGCSVPFLLDICKRHQMLHHTCSVLCTEYGAEKQKTWKTASHKTSQRTPLTASLKIISALKVIALT